MNRIEEIKARLNAAMPGPWQVRFWEEDYPIISLSHKRICAMTSFHSVKTKGDNAEFIAHAPEDIRYLLEVHEFDLGFAKKQTQTIKSLREEIRQLEQKEANRNE